MKKKIEFSLAQQMKAYIAKADEEAEKKKQLEEKKAKNIDCRVIYVDYKPKRSTSETRKIDEHKYFMQLCSDTQTNQEKIEEMRAI